MHPAIGASPGPWNPLPARRMSGGSREWRDRTYLGASTKALTKLASYWDCRDQPSVALAVT